VGRIAGFQREGVGRAAVEPDIEDVGDLFVLGRIVVAEEVFVRCGEPHVCAALGDGGNDAGINLGIDQRLSGGLVHEHGQRGAPCALTADQPVRTTFNHRTDTVLARGWIEGRRVDGVQRTVAQGVTVG